MPPKSLYNLLETSRLGKRKNVDDYTLEVSQSKAIKLENVETMGDAKNDQRTEPLIGLADPAATDLIETDQADKTNESGGFERQYGEGIQKAESYISALHKFIISERILDSMCKSHSDDNLNANLLQSCFEHYK